MEPRDLPTLVDGRKDRSDVQPLTKGTDGATGTRPWVCKWGNDPCARTVPCKQCKGARVRRTGLAKQRQAKKLLGVPNSRFHGQDGNEENWRGAFVIEVKSQGFAKPVGTKFALMEEQASGNKAVGDSRPFLGVCMPPGWGADGVVLLRASVWQQRIVPLINEYGGLA